MRELRPWLFQGDISDLNALPINLADTTGRTVAQKYGITLAVNVGSMPFVPRNLPTIYLPMQDEEDQRLNDWPRIIRDLRLVIDEVRAGGKVFVNCDVGVSRSVVFSGMLISALEHRDMNDELMQEIRADLSEPLRALWVNAYWAMIEYWGFRER